MNVVADDEEIRKYFFTVFEAQQMLGTISTKPITSRLRSGEAIGVRQGRSWMVQPDQITVLRNIIPSCRKKLQSSPQRRQA